MNWKIALMFLSLALAQLVGPVNGHAAQISILDDFNDGVLDPAWNITKENVKSWTYQEAGSKLTVSNIVSTLSGQANWGAAVTLGRSFDPVGDFKIDFDFSWAKTNVTQLSELWLFGKTAGGSLFRLAFSECDNFDYRGNLGYNDMNGYVMGLLTDGPSGSRSIDISRTNGVMMVMVNGVELVTYNTPVIDPTTGNWVTNHTPLFEPLTGIDIYFRGGGSQGPNYTLAPFATVAVDKIQLTGTTVASTATPEPASLLLMGGGFGLMAFLRRRSRRRAGLASQ